MLSIILAISFRRPVVIISNPYSLSRRVHDLFGGQQKVMIGQVLVSYSAWQVLAWCLLGQLEQGAHTRMGYRYWIQRTVNKRTVSGECDTQVGDCECLSTDCVMMEAGDRGDRERGCNQSGREGPNWPRPFVFGKMGGAESYEKEAVKGMWRDRRQKHDGKFCRRTPSSQGRGLGRHPTN